MMLLRRPFVLVMTGLLVGCGARVRPVTAPPQYVLPLHAFQGIPAPSVTLSLDPSTTIIAKAETEFAAGEAELAQGHRVAARERFDAAIDALLTAPGGARRDARLAAEYEKLLDRIGAREAVELRAGDGFAEAKSEPAAIDNLLAFGAADRPATPAATADLVADDLRRTPHDIPIKVTDKVLSYIELFQGNLRSFVAEGLERGARYLPMIQDVFQAEGLPLDLAYVPLIESAFKNTALSRAAAKGMWQFGAGTGREMDLQQNWFLDERSDPEKATRAAAQYLKLLHGMFGGDWNLALAAYNAGMGRLQTAMKRAHTNDYWVLTSSTRYLPRETREYVPMILAAILVARNPVQYGFEIGPVEPFGYELVTVPDALRLDTVAEWLEMPVESIQALNPELRRGMTPVGRHQLKVPVGAAPIIEQQLAAAPPSLFASANFHFHTVKRGETLATIARQYKVTRLKLAAANDLKTTSRVRAGTQLMVPTAPASALAARTSSSSGVRTAAAPAQPPATYRVKPGDTLSRIARQFDTSVAELKTLNRLSSDALSIGTRLTVRP